MTLALLHVAHPPAGCPGHILVEKDEEQEGEGEMQVFLQASAFVTFAKIPLVKASHGAETEISGAGCQAHSGDS